MNVYNPASRNLNTNKKPCFNFRSNVSPMSRRQVPIPDSSSMKFSRGFMKAPETPLVGINRHGSNSRVSEAPITYQKSYASAIEPMDSEDWGEDGNFASWGENQVYEMGLSSMQHQKSYDILTRRGSSNTNPMRQNAVSNVQITSHPDNNFVEKSLRQSVLKSDDANGLSFKLEPKPKRKILSNIQGNEKKLYPKWSYSGVEFKLNMDDKDICFPRIFTVTIEKLQKWPEKLTGSKAIFELYGILESMSMGRFPKSKRITLKSETMKDRLTCTFYEIDRVLPPLERGHWQRCIILFRNNKEYQCLQIRSATPNELKILDKMVTTSSKAKALLIKTAT